MSWAANRDAIERRRQLVAQMRLRGFTVREIVAGLVEARCLNPKDSKPWSVGTVHSDIKALTTQWRKSAAQDTAALKGMTFARLEEVIRESYRSNDRRLVLDAIKQERELFGIDAPKQAQIGGIPGGDPILVENIDLLQGVNLDSLNDEELETLDRALALIARCRAESQGGEG